MDWQNLTKSASEPSLLRSELSATLRMADEANTIGYRAEVIRLIQEAYAMSDRFALITAGVPSTRLLGSEEAPV